MQTLNLYLQSGDTARLEQNYPAYLCDNMRQNETQTVRFALNVINHLIRDSVPLEQACCIVRTTASVFPEQTQAHLRSLAAWASDKQHRFLASALYFRAYPADASFPVEKLHDRIVLIRKQAAEHLAAAGLLSEQNASVFTEAVASLTDAHQISVLARVRREQRPLVSGYVTALGSELLVTEKMLQEADLFRALSVQVVYRKAVQLEMLPAFSRALLQHLVEEKVDVADLLDAVNYSILFTRSAPNSILRAAFLEEALRIYNGLKEVDAGVFQRYLESHVTLLGPEITPAELLMVQNLTVDVCKKVVRQLKKAECPGLLMVLSLRARELPGIVEELGVFYSNNFESLPLSYHQQFIEILRPEQSEAAAGLMLSQAILQENQQTDLAQIAQDSQYAAHVSKYLGVSASLISTQGESPTQTVLELRSKIGRAAGALFGAFFRGEMMGIPPGTAQELLIETLFAVSVVLSSPGLRDFHLENLFTWVSNCVDQLDLRGATFLREMMVGGQETEPHLRALNTQVLQLYVGLIVDLLHLLAQFKFQVPEEVPVKAALQLMRLLQHVKTDAFVQGKLQTEELCKTCLLALLKLANQTGAENTRAFVAIGTAVGAVAFNWTREVCKTVVFIAKNTRTFGALRAFFSGLACMAKAYKFDPEEGNEKLDLVVEDLVTQDPWEGEQVAAEFLSLLVTGNCQEYIQEMVDEYLEKAVSRLKLGALAAFLNQKCGYKLKEAQGCEIDREALSEWNAACQVAQQIVAEFK